MARHPEWFVRLDLIEETLRESPVLALGRPEIRAAFGVSERDAIRLLHRFGGESRANALSLPRSALLAQLYAVRQGPAYQAFERQRQAVAQHLAQARDESRARQFRARSSPVEFNDRASLGDLPQTIAWRRSDPVGPGRFEIRYDNGEDLMWQLSEFLRVAGQNRAEFFRATEPAP